MMKSQTFTCKEHHTWKWKTKHFLFPLVVVLDLLVDMLCLYS